MIHLSHGTKRTTKQNKISPTLPQTSLSVTLLFIQCLRYSIFSANSWGIIADRLLQKSHLWLWRFHLPQEIGTGSPSFFSGWQCTPRTSAAIEELNVNLAVCSQLAKWKLLERLEKSWVSALWLITAFLGSWSSSPCAEAPSQRAFPGTASPSTSDGAAKGSLVPPPEPIPRLCPDSRCRTAILEMCGRTMSRIKPSVQCWLMRPMVVSPSVTPGPWLMGQVSLTPMAATCCGRGHSAPFIFPSTKWARAAPARRAMGCPWMSLGNRESQCHPFNAEGSSWWQTWPLQNISSVPSWWRLLWEHSHQWKYSLAKWI